MECTPKMCFLAFKMCLIEKGLILCVVTEVRAFFKSDEEKLVCGGLLGSVHVKG